jgi:ribosomal protein S18 acetylase RimI-like enzyme
MFNILFKKIRRNRLDYGWFVCIQKIFANIFKPVFESRAYHLYVIDLKKAVLQQPRVSKGFEFRFIDHSETTSIVQIENMEEWLHGKLVHKLQNGQKCLVALQGDTVAGFNLIGFNTLELPLIRLKKPLRPVECFSEQITVHPQFRNRGLGTDLRHEVFSAMKSAGYHRLYGGTQICNCANKTLSKKVGLVDFAEVRFMNIAGFIRLSIKRKKR